MHTTEACIVRHRSRASKEGPWTRFGSEIASSKADVEHSGKRTEGPSNEMIQRGCKSKTYLSKWTLGGELRPAMPAPSLGLAATAEYGRVESPMPNLGKGLHLAPICREI